MERLTWRRDDGVVCPRVPRDSDPDWILGKFTQQVYDRLAEYEETGLDPIGIEAMRIVHGVTRQMRGRMIMCEECMSEHCIWNPEGICRYPLVYGKKPEIDDEYGCHACIVPEEST